jgi:Fe-S-cluster-containing hydrogenase component 2
LCKERRRRKLEGGAELLKHGTNQPEVEESKCNGCELCVTVCPSFVLEMRDKKAEVVRGMSNGGHLSQRFFKEGISFRNGSSPISGSPPTSFSGKEVPSNLQERTCVGGIVEADS